MEAWADNAFNLLGQLNDVFKEIVTKTQKRDQVLEKELAPSLEQLNVLLNKLQDNIWLQIMDYGKATDTNGLSIDFSHTIVIMTTNAGAETISRRSIGFSHQDHTSDGMEVIRKQFTPEFRNRLDSIIQFAALTRDNIMYVVDKFLVELQAQLDDKKVHMHINDEARKWFAENGYDEKMGARPMNRLIQEKLKKPLAEKILFGDLEGGGEVDICLNDAKDGIELHLVEEVVA